MTLGLVEKDSKLDVIPTTYVTCGQNCLFVDTHFSTIIITFDDKSVFKETGPGDRMNLIL